MGQSTLTNTPSGLISEGRLRRSGIGCRLRRQGSGRYIQQIAPPGKQVSVPQHRGKPREGGSRQSWRGPRCRILARTKQVKQG